MLTDFDLYGEFAPLDTPMPLQRGDLLDLLINAEDGDDGQMRSSLAPPACGLGDKSSSATRPAT